MDLTARLARYEKALASFLDRVRQDRTVLAVVQVGSLTLDTIWHREGIGLWIVEIDGVTLRRKSDGEDPHIRRTYVEDDVNLWAQLIPRSRFKKMVEGSSRTAFSYNFFAERTLVYSADESITRWFEQANALAVRDQQLERFVATTWVMGGRRHLHRLLEVREDVQRAWQAALGVAGSLAAVTIVAAGEICETEAIYRAMVLEPELFEATYTALLTRGPDQAAVEAALVRIDAWLDEHGEANVRPLLQLLEKQARPVPLSELADRWAYSQLYPWHIEGACEWLARRGLVEKLAADVPLTKKSRVLVEEPAYYREG
jgi:hypothetical protein